MQAQRFGGSDGDCRAAPGRRGDEGEFSEEFPVLEDAQCRDVAERRCDAYRDVAARDVVLLPGHEASAARPRQQVRHAAVAVPDPAGLQVVGRPARVALYGDSLASEAVKPFIDAVTVNGRAEVRTGVFGGTAICDWFDQMRQDAAWQPDAVVVEFSGNALTACMANGRTSGTAWLQRYYTDAAAVLSIFPSTRVYFVATPISRSLA